MQRVNVLLNHLTAAPACERLSAASVAAVSGSASGKLSGHVAIITGSGNGIGAPQSVGVC
jgi:hypothetical protein